MIIGYLIYRASLTRYYAITVVTFHLFNEADSGLGYENALLPGDTAEREATFKS